MIIDNFASQEVGGGSSGYKGGWGRKQWVHKRLGEEEVGTQKAICLN